jgi:hypothetical protein
LIDSIADGFQRLINGKVAQRAHLFFTERHKKISCAARPLGVDYGQIRESPLRTPRTRSTLSAGTLICSCVP